ncbi:nucleoside hydrolase [Lysobacter korlensis]|uniref:Nucleoside hydrolase n=1 Tax=Lysobacter korlensis TaxID=553636 RepID=A0ABV6RYJ3_9GAMM
MSPNPVFDIDRPSPRAGHGPARRLVIDNDWAGDPDGLLGLAHHLLSSDRVDAITSSLTSPMFPGSHDGAARGHRLVEELLDVVDAPTRPALAVGAESSLDRGGAASDASRLIVEHARREDELPLTLVCAGPLTNVAVALRDAPDIAARIRLVWVGGSTRGAFEYNEATDQEAAAIVFGSEIAIDQYPLEAYRASTYSIAELEADLTETTLGSWLWDVFAQFRIPLEFKVGELWHLGDSLPLLATSLAATPEGPTVHRVVHETVDYRLLVGDMLAKFRLHERGRAA